MDGWPDYPWLEQAAAEARRASRRYWAKGGAADVKYPVHEDIERMWPLAGDEPTPAEQPKTRRGFIAGGD